MSAYPVDVDGDGVSSWGDRAVFQWWLDHGGDLLSAISKARPAESDSQTLTIDVSGFFALQVQAALGSGDVPLGPLDATCDELYSGPPVSMGDADDNSAVNITDAEYVLLHLFQGGPAPKWIDTTRVLKTGQYLCFGDDIFDEPVDCSTIESGSPFYGQDGNYRGQVGLERCYVLGPDLDGNEVYDTVIDVRTGLMWQRHPQVLNRNLEDGQTFTLAAARTKADALTTETYGDWRLPTIGELFSVFDYSRTSNGEVSVSDIFEWVNWGIDKIWSDTNYAPDSSRHWRMNPYQAHMGTSTDNNPDNGFAAVRSRRALPHTGDEVPANSQFQLGDSDGNGALELTDAVRILNFLFQSGPAPKVFSVRPIVPSSVVTGRFVDNLDGTVSDTLTGLMWMKEPIDFSSGLLNGCGTYLGGVRLWEDALELAEDLAFPPVQPPLIPHGDWRLPNVFELATLANYADWSPPALASVFVACPDGGCVEGSPSVGCWRTYWSSTTSELTTNRAFQFYPNGSAGGMDGGSAGAGALREESNVPLLGVKIWSDVWVFPVRGPTP